MVIYEIQGWDNENLTTLGDPIYFESPETLFEKKLITCIEKAISIDSEKVTPKWIEENVESSYRKTICILPDASQEETANFFNLKLETRYYALLKINVF